ncbi:MAG: hypothetical protein JSW33_06975 [bacterium]|nr:MAG: hypothetical protein JSW33_06975 [bacterium]
MYKGILIFIISLFLFGCEKQEQTGLLKIPPGSPAFFQTDIPRPILTEHENLSDLYWRTWKILYQKIRRGTPQNNFVPEYLDEGFNEMIYQWDSCFMAMFATYGGKEFPAMQTLDNFYGKQRSDGWICRVYFENNGEPAQLPSEEEPMINPPLFAWVEWKYYLLTADASRLDRILPVLDRYFNWIESACKGDNKADGLYYTTHLGSGMDNSPREGIERGGWVDLSAQMALSAKFIMFIAREVGNETLASVYRAKYQHLSRMINNYLWDEQQGFYFDLMPSGRKIQVKTAAAFWTLAAEVATFPQARRLAEHLQQPDEFYRQHLFPSLSADHPQYDPQGHYWKGGVWAPLNYTIVKGLDMYPLRELAWMAAMNHLQNMTEVYTKFKPDTSQIAPGERDGDYQTIWESYAPDVSEPASRWDARYLVRQDFVGWSGLGPIALLLENVIGLQPVAPENKLYWDLRLREKHGVENYRFGDNVVDIICESNGLPAGPAVIKINSNSPFELTVSTQIGKRTFQIEEGSQTYLIEL